MKWTLLSPFAANDTKTQCAVWKFWKNSRLQNNTQIHLCFAYQVFTVSSGSTYNIICLCLLFLLNYAKCCCFSRVIDSRFQNIFSVKRCYFFKLPFCLVAVLMPVFHINCLLLVCLCVFGGMWYKNCGT